MAFYESRVVMIKMRDVYLRAHTVVAHRAWETFNVRDERKRGVEDDSEVSTFTG